MVANDIQFKRSVVLIFLIFVLSYYVSLRS